MPAPEPRNPGLDPAHILSITNQATSGVRGSTARAVATTDSVRVRLRSRRVARDATAALRRVGYQVARIDGTGQQDVLVTGWSAAALESRLAAMRTVLHQLDGSPAVTAAAVIDRIRHLPARSPVPPDTALLTEASARLRDWVSARSGIHAPHDPAILPAERHVRVAQHALSLFGSLRQHMTDDQAQRAAVRRADVPSRLNTSLAQDSSAQDQGTARPPGTGPRLPGPDPGGGTPAGPACLAACDFPQSLRDAVSSGGGPSALPTRSGGRHFPAGRLGPRR